MPYYELSNVQSPFKPEFFCRPRQILRRLAFQPSDDAVLPLPWDCTIQASSREVIGYAIATQGVYDLPLTEAILRLTAKGEVALDVGGNIGYMSLVFALAAGPQGRVVCYEPNPELLPRLQANVAAWKQLPIAPIGVKAIALSDRNGEARLGFPEEYGRNRGTASMEVEGGVPVCARRLDDLDVDGAAVMKVDVEGHEASVFQGARRLLARKSVRDIFFEEHNSYPAASHRILLEHGYRIFRLSRSLWRPRLLAADTRSRHPDSPSNFLATVDAARALARFRAWGWIALGRQRRTL